MKNDVHLVECPRDAMQGWSRQITTEEKIKYILSLMEVGFHTIDFGSFVSAKAIPQMVDTKEVVKGIEKHASRSALLAIVANERGAEEASEYEVIRYLGFPFSISETFQVRNTNSGRGESLERVKAIREIAEKHGKEVVVYLSMGFGNPYGDEYNSEILSEWTGKLYDLGIRILSLADTVGLATPSQISAATSSIVAAYQDAEVGVHLHSTAENMEEKINAALFSGCRRFDGALKGIGGCPMAGNELVGNMDTLAILDVLQQHRLAPDLNKNALQTSLQIADSIFVK